MSRIFTRLAALILLIPLAGCLSTFDGNRASAEDRWGLGLEMPAEWPQPGPYKEPEDQVRELESFLRSAGTTIGNDCNPDTLSSMNKSFQRGYVLGALGSLLLSCSNRSDLPWANETTARQSLAETKAALNAAMPPATIVETEFLSALISYYQGVLGLSNMSKDAKWAQGESDAVRALVLSYPWKEGSCSFPGFDGFVAEARAKAEQVLNAPVQGSERTAGYAEDEKTFVREARGFIRIDLEEGWWPRIPRERDGIDFEAAVIDNASRSIWPTWQEARLIVDQFRNTTRSLTTDSAVAGQEWIFTNWKPNWEHDPWPAMQILGIPALQWRYGGVVCTSEPNS